MDYWLMALLLAFGLWLIIEGAIYAIAPDFMKRMTAMIAQMPRGQIMQSGLWSVALGVLIAYIAVRFT